MVLANGDRVVAVEECDRGTLTLWKNGEKSLEPMMLRRRARIYSEVTYLKIYAHKHITDMLEVQ